MTIFSLDFYRNNDKFTVNQCKEAFVQHDTGQRARYPSGSEDSVLRTAALLTAIVALMAVLLPVPMRAQWERLPLYAGHADWLIQNKYQYNEIFAIIAYGGIYRSEDYGETWNTVVTDICRLGWDRIQDFDVSATGKYYVTINAASRSPHIPWRIWRSSDKGNTWFADSMLSKYNTNPVGIIEAHPDSTVLITSFFNRNIIKSRNDFVNIDTITIDGANWAAINLFCHPVSSEIIFRVDITNMDETRLFRTSDKGINWSHCDYPHDGTAQALKNASAESRNILGLWYVDAYFPQSNLYQYDYYESNDDGISWSHEGKVSIITPHWAWNENIEAWYDLKGVSLMSTIHTLYRSTDANRTVDTLKNISIWDFLPVKDHLLASTNFDGLMTSTDLGLTWHVKQNSRAFGGFSSIEYAAATSDTMFSILRDVTGYQELDTAVPRNTQAIFQSNDGGMSWRMVARDTSYLDLRATSRPVSAFYAVQNGSALIRGNAETGRIDTLFITKGRIAYFKNSDVFPNDIYIVEAPSFDSDNPSVVHFSTDRGTNWTRFFSLPAKTEDAVVLPSRIERGKAFVTCESTNDLADPYMGLYDVTEYGKNVAYSLHTLDHLRIALFGEDILFRENDRMFSFDGGRTWEKNDAGLDTMDIKNYESYFTEPMFTLDNRLYLPWGTRWLKFMNGRWHKVRDVSGNPVSRTTAMAFGEVGEYIYAGTQYDGLYRIRIQDPTGIEHTTPDNKTLWVNAYPNPFTQSVTIRYAMNDVERTPARLVISDLLGRIVYRRDIENREGFVEWDCADLNGNAPGTGVYLATLLTAGRTRSMLLLKAR
jgi:hypothetical protein